MKKLIVFILLAGIVKMGIAQLDWNCNPADYQFTHNITGKIVLEWGALPEGEITLGAFVNDTCRGTATCSEIGNLMYLTMYANQNEGEQVQFHFKDGDDNVYELDNIVMFRADAITCSPANPFEWMTNLTYATTDFFSFKVQGFTGTGAIDTQNQTIDLKIPDELGLENLVPEFEVAPGANVYVNNEMQESGESTQDFNQDVTYNVIGVDGASGEWTVSVELGYTGIEHTAASEISVFPTCIKHGRIYIKTGNTVNYKIFTIAGQPIKTGTATRGTNTLGLSNQGTYVIAFYDEGNLFKTTKVVVE